MPNIYKDIPMGELRLLYKQGKSLSEIGAIFNTNPSTILNRMKQFGIPRRTVSDSLKGRVISWKYKISESTKGRVISVNQRMKMSATRKLRKIIPWNKSLSKAENPDIITYGMSEADALKADKIEVVKYVGRSELLVDIHYYKDNPLTLEFIRNVLHETV